MQHRQQCSSVPMIMAWMIEGQGRMLMGEDTELPEYCQLQPEISTADVSAKSNVHVHLREPC